MAGTCETAIQAIEAVPAPLLRSAKLFSIDGRMIVTILDLSADEAVATTQAPPPAGSVAVLARSGVRIAATIAWVNGRRFGLRIDEPIEPATVQQFVGGFRDMSVRLPALLLDEVDRAAA